MFSCRGVLWGGIAVGYPVATLPIRKPPEVLALTASCSQSLKCAVVWMSPFAWNVGYLCVTMHLNHTSSSMKFTPRSSWVWVLVSRSVGVQFLVQLSNSVLVQCKSYFAISLVIHWCVHFPFLFMVLLSCLGFECRVLCRRNAPKGYIATTPKIQSRSGFETIIKTRCQ